MVCRAARTFSPCQVHQPTVHTRRTVAMMMPSVFPLEEDTSYSAHGLQVDSGWLDMAYQPRKTLTITRTLQCGYTV